MKEVLDEIRQLNESRLIKIKNFKRIVLAGDTHGDLETSKQIIEYLLDNSTTLIFLGDYVDRGEKSKENIDFLLNQKIKHPKQIYLLQGNHEGYPFLKFGPVNFWNNLDKEEFKIYKEIFKQLPLVASFNNIIALHGSLPDLESLEDINQVKLGSGSWKRITWGDFSSHGDIYSKLSGRPQFSKEYFKRKMDDFGKKFLIRSHQPNCSTKMFNGRCFTIFTSSAYTKNKRVAVVSNNKKISEEDINIKKI